MAIFALMLANKKQNSPAGAKAVVEARYSGVPQLWLPVGMYLIIPVVFVSFDSV
ncbi:hypothetical protein [Oleiphilus messinensis]|uniref:hypothetical protein n=1 Tax=Oleiphilus messinensis TaxID=141451 RepID=UPI0012FBA395|nr:hypothetical protein [Oleiphilus messinensis]